MLNFNVSPAKALNGGRTWARTWDSLIKSGIRQNNG